MIVGVKVVLWQLLYIIESTYSLINSIIRTNSDSGGLTLISYHLTK